MAGGQQPDDTAGDDDVTGFDQRVHRLIGGAQPAGMVDADNAASGQHTRVDDGPTARSQDRRAR
jgi:hypothetical protein